MRPEGVAELHLVVRHDTQWRGSLTNWLVDVAKVHTIGSDGDAIGLVAGDR